MTDTRRHPGGAALSRLAAFIGFAFLLAACALPPSEPIPASPPAMTKSDVIAAQSGVLPPPATITPARPDELTVMAFNIRLGLGTDEPKGRIFHMPWGRSLNRVVSAIKSVRPDIVGLQEVAGEEQMRELANTLNMHYAFEYHGTGSARQPWWGVGILSRYPISNTTGKRISGPHRNVKHVLLAKIRTPVGIVTAVSVHKDKDINTGKPVSVLLKALSKTSDPIVILGDFNMKPHYKRMRRVFARFPDTLMTANSAASRYARARGTFSANRARIDYILTSRNRFDIVDAGLVDSSHHDASDHLALIATLRLKPAK